MLRLINFLFLAISFTGYSQDSTYQKRVYAGGYIVVPDSQSWTIDRIFINGGDAYSISISNSNFNLTYDSGDTIRTPNYIAEMELLDNKELVQYQFYFRLIDE